jgi:hypothetical protein
MKLVIIQKIIYPVYMTNNNEIFALVNAAATAVAGFAAFLQLQSKNHESVSCEFFL